MIYLPGYASYIPGFMNEEECMWLYHKATRYTSVVEIGSWLGRSTYCLLAGCSGFVTVVDHFLGTPSERDTNHIEARLGNIKERFMQNVGMFPNLQVLEMDSASGSIYFQPRSVDMVFIDADHSQEEVERDLALWSPITKKFLCGHDRNMSGVNTALKSRGIDYKEGPGSIWYVELL